MKPILRNSFLMGLMIVAAGLAYAMTPRIRLADESAPIHLESMVPAKFGDWTLLPSGSAIVVDPGRQQLIDRIYSESLSRVYVNSHNYAIMLSIAYGRDQRDEDELHQPEVCYPAQGFTVLDSAPTKLQMAGQSVPAMRLNTQGPRPEPLTYWTVIGQRNYRGGTAKKFAEMSYGLRGTIPDGMLVRISSVDPKPDKAYAAQAQFAADFASALPDSVRARFLGSPTL